MRIRRGEVYLANLGDVKHTDIGKTRPVLVLQNDNLNRMIEDGLYSEVIIVPLSSQIKKSDFTMVIKKRDKLEKDSTILCNAIKMISVKRLLLNKGILLKLTEGELVEVEKRVTAVLGVNI